MKSRPISTRKARPGHRGTRPASFFLSSSGAPLAKLPRPIAKSLHLNRQHESSNLHESAAKEERREVELVSVHRNYQHICQLPIGSWCLVQYRGHTCCQKAFMCFTAFLVQEIFQKLNLHVQVTPTARSEMIIRELCGTTPRVF